VGSEEEAVAKSFWNIPSATVALASAAGVADVLGASSMVITEAALEELKGRAT
jgi:ribosomal protein L4